VTAFYLDDPKTCRACLGARRLSGEPCATCAGTGRVSTAPEHRNEIKLDEQRPMPREHQL
jgi:DnaJ-class molecular chaperone